MPQRRENDFPGQTESFPLQTSSVAPRQTPKLIFRTSLPGKYVKIMNNIEQRNQESV